jgi:hypothetical protein
MLEKCTRSKGNGSFSGIRGIVTTVEVARYRKGGMYKDRKYTWSINLVVLK